jgi:hypothetical protein
MVFVGGLELKSFRLKSRTLDHSSAEFVSVCHAVVFTTLQRLNLPWCIQVGIWFSGLDIESFIIKFRFDVWLFYDAVYITEDVVIRQMR